MEAEGDRRLQNPKRDAASREGHRGHKWLCGLQCPTRGREVVWLLRRSRCQPFGELPVDASGMGAANSEPPFPVAAASQGAPGSGAPAGLGGFLPVCRASTHKVAPHPGPRVVAGTQEALRDSAGPAPGARGLAGSGANGLRKPRGARPRQNPKRAAASRDTGDTSGCVACSARPEGGREGGREAGC